MFIFLIYRKDFLETQKRVRISHGKRVIGVRVTEVSLHDLQHEKTYLLSNCVPCEGSYQPAHSLSLNRIFTGHFLIVKDAKFLHSDNEDSDHNARMCRLIRFFTGPTCPRVRFLTLQLVWFHFTDYNSLTYPLLLYRHKNMCLGR